MCREYKDSIMIFTLTDIKENIENITYGEKINV